jgi:hypothetical protein
MRKLTLVAIVFRLATLSVPAWAQSNLEKIKTDYATVKCKA